MPAEATKIKSESCLRCKKDRSTWLQNREGFRSYCCWGCADNTGCICGRKTHRKTMERDVKDPHAHLFMKGRGGRRKKVVAEITSE